MPNLYWKSAGESIVSVADSQFDSEEKFEEYLFQNSELLGDIFILRRQVRTGLHQGILDMVGVDHDKRVCLIELKNQTVTEDVLPQVLGYAIWAEGNPDSIKALWLESPDRPKDLDVDWGNVDPRIIIVAPSYGPNILKMAVKIGYDIELLQVRRFTHDTDEFHLEPIQQP